MNEGREPKSLLWCELQQVQIDKLVNHRHGGEETSKQTHAHSPNWPVPLDIAFDQITQVKSVKFAHYTYVQIHALEPNPLDLLVNSVETDVKRPVQDNDLHVMSIHLSCCHKHFHRDALVHFSRQQFELCNRLSFFSFIWQYTAVPKRKTKKMKIHFQFLWF